MFHETRNSVQEIWGQRTPYEAGIYALLGKGAVPDGHPYVMGGLGLLGTAPSQDAMKECDTFFIVGSSFPYHQFLPMLGQAKCVQIDIDAARIDLRYPG